MFAAATDAKLYTLAVILKKRLSMKEILLALSLISIKLGDIKYSEKQSKEKWIGYEAATTEQIQAAEKRLKIKLPKDYVEFLEITNGFSSPNQIEPSFMKIEEIDYLKNVDPFLLEVWVESVWDIGEQLERSIIVGGKEEEQYFLLIPPKEENGKWKYWTFASWIPGEQEHSDLKSYFQYVIEFNKQNIDK